jgi:hypothetical protein
MSPLPRWPRFFLGLVLFFVAFAAAPRSARAATASVDVYSVWYAEDTSDQEQLEAFLGCLTQSSTFPRWAAQWGATVRMHGPYVLRWPAPDLLVDGDELGEVIDEAIDAGFVPAPTGFYDTVYVVHAPRTTRAENVDGRPLCGQSGECAEHVAGTYRSLAYEMALVPLACDACGGTLRVGTHYAEHEIAEAVADEMGSSFEVGDSCDGSVRNAPLACGGWSADVQALAGPNGACQIVTANTCVGPGAACAADEDCCDGTTCAQGTCAAPASAARCDVGPARSDGAGGSLHAVSFALAVAGCALRRRRRRAAAVTRCCAAPPRSR